METLAQIAAHLAHSPGIYIYKNSLGEVIYVGKAKDLRKRVSQYFQRDDVVGPKTALLVSNIASIETIETASEFDALLLEAKLIHDYQPKYNVVLKDDKSPLYILLTTSEELPHVLTMRKSDLPQKITKRDILFGPFQSAHIVRSLLRHLRRSIPYCTQKRRTGKPCFYTHLGLCMPCPSEIADIPQSDKREEMVKTYRANIFRIKSILSGKSSDVMHDLEKEMRKSASENAFEKATFLRNQLQNLHYLLATRYDPTLYISSDSAVGDIYSNELRTLQQALLPYIPEMKLPLRIECMDISNTSGQFATGSMVVLTDGKKDTSQYRHFRIRTKDEPNDFAMMAEVISRRFRHPEWPYPDLLVIDGGKGQVAAAKAAIPSNVEGIIALIGLAKRYEEVIIPISKNEWKVLRLNLTNPAAHVLERIRDEAHRFAITYHRKLRAAQFV